MANMRQGLLVVALLPLCISVSGVLGKGDKCFSRGIQPIPSDHLFHSMTKPIVIGHRGNPRIYQENTLDSFKSILDDNVGGFEVDIYLTKDKRLVLFHDDNTMFLTGENHTIYDMTYEEIQKLRVKDKLEYKYGSGKKVWSFDKTRKIPLLEELLEMVKDRDMIMYLEMKPSHFKNFQHSLDTGKELAKTVRQFGLEKKAMINSFDNFKTMAAKQEHPDVVVGNFFSRDEFNDASYLRTENKDKMPGMSNCTDTLPQGTAYMTYLLEYGTILRAINGSFVDMWYKMYNNPEYTNDTYEKIKKNYGASFGGWTIYTMQETEEEWEAADQQIQALIDNGGDRLITDNYPKLLKKLGRPLTKSEGSSLTVNALCKVLLIAAAVAQFLSM